MMDIEMENNDWKKEAPTLAAMAKKNPFALPAGYFESSEATITQAVFLADLKEKINAGGFSIPENYFSNLTDRVETHIALALLPQKNSAFSVPDDYFNQLQNKINQKIKAENTSKPKVVTLWKQRWIKYASAACFILIASISFYFYQIANINQNNFTQTEEVSSSQDLYDIDESTIIDHLEHQTHAAIKQKSNSASDTEMENYILSNFSSGDLSQELNN